MNPSAPRPAGVGLIDVHHHFVPPFYLEENLDRLAASWGGALSPPWFGWSPAASMEAMDRAGIERSILSISSPGGSTSMRHASGTTTRAVTACSRRFRFPTWREA